MIFLRQAKLNGFYIFWLLIIFLTASCGPVEQSEANPAQVIPTPPSEQPVEYGASLNEWEKATQIESNNGVNTGLEPAPAVNATVSAETEANSAASSGETSTGSMFTLDDLVYREIIWDTLIPAGFTAEAIMTKYDDQLAMFEDGSPEAFDLYTQMQEEFNNAPVNESMDGTFVRLAGFIAPLEYTDDLITEFLLVPYFGACIHVPPPPANQTVLVKLSEGQGIKFEDAYYPFWIMGQLTAEDATTDLAEAGYYIEGAFFELYSDDT